MTLDHPKPIIPLLALLTATLFWGSSFFTISHALESTNPLTLLTTRFTISIFLLMPILGFSKITKIKVSTWFAGACCALAIFGTYGLNTLGLVKIPSSMSGFLTALYVPLTPFVFWLTYRKLPDAFAFVGIALAFTGLVLLANPFELTFENNWGEWATIACAFCSALEIVILGIFAPKCNAKELAFTQIVCVALYSWIALFVVNSTEIFILKTTTWSITLILEIVWLSTIVAVVQVLLSWAQRFVPASRAAVIFAMESVFAAIIGYIAGEELGFWGLTGGALIFIGTLVTESKTLLGKR